MKSIKLITPYGECSGVKRAIEEIIKIDSSQSFLLGKLIHNENFDQILKEKHIEVLNRPYIKSLEKVDKDAIIIIGAHGLSLAEESFIKENYKNYLDLTCPIIKKQQALIRSTNNPYFIGKASHEETLSAISDGAILIEDCIIDNLPNSFTCFYQTTIDDLFLKETLRKIKDKDIKLIDSGCNVFKLRKEKLSEELAANANSKVLIIGSSTSSNAISLYNMANKTNKTYLINHVDDLDKCNLSSDDNLIIATATSALSSDVEKIMTKLKDL